MSETESSYDRLAGEYTRRLFDELSHKPFDRKMLDWLAERVPDGKPICDMGCGPGHIARYLKDQGVAVCGVDLSSEMVRTASSLSPDIPFEQGDMLSLASVPENSYSGIAAFYAIVHIAPDKLGQVFQSLQRTLVPGGVLLVTFHIGTEVRHFDTLWDVPVSLNFIFHQTDSVRNALEAAGFVILEAIERDPYLEVEVQTRRAYLFATKPA